MSTDKFIKLLRKTLNIPCDYKIEDGPLTKDEIFDRPRNLILLRFENVTGEDPVLHWNDWDLALYGSDISGYEVYSNEEQESVELGSRDLFDALREVFLGWLALKTFSML